MRAALFALLLAGCPLPDPRSSWDAADEDCTAEARDAYYDGGVSKTEAAQIYADCMCKAGHCQ